MGKTKQLLPFRKTTILGQVVNNAKNSTLDEIIVVLGHDADNIEKAINLSNTQIVRNPSFSKGQSSSLIKGLETASPECDAAMFLLGDQPFVSIAVINKLISAFTASKALIVIPYYKTRRGNPVIIDRSLFDRLDSISADKGARVLFEEFKKQTLKVTITDKSILTDVDTIEDYERIVKISPMDN